MVDKIEPEICYRVRKKRFFFLTFCLKQKKSKNDFPNPKPDCIQHFSLSSSSFLLITILYFDRKRVCLYRNKISIQLEENIRSRRNMKKWSDKRKGWVLIASSFQKTRKLEGEYVNGYHFVVFTKFLHRVHAHPLKICCFNRQ